MYYSVYYPIMKKLRQFDLFFIYPVMEFLSLFVQLFFVLLINVIKQIVGNEKETNR